VGILEDLLLRGPKNERWIWLDPKKVRWGSTGWRSETLMNYLMVRNPAAKNPAKPNGVILNVMVSGGKSIDL
jgi:hypothetical protein